MTICKKKKNKCIYDVCHAEDYFSTKSRSKVSVESLCFSMLKWCELMNYCRLPCWDISREYV